MGKLTNSLLSGSSGRTGRLVVANVGDVEILKVRPRKRTSPPTARQSLVQARMKQAYTFVSPYKQFASDWFGEKAGLKSRFNQAMANVMAAFKLDYATMTINPAWSEIEFARGPLLSAVPQGVAPGAASEFVISWFDNSAGDPEREADRLQVLYMAEGETKPVLLENAAQRIDASYTVAVLPILQGKTVQVWMAFRSDAMTSVSGSVYLGSVIIP